ncbi:unnamed protein product, partial [Didymodactylos carnosus]
YKLGRIFDFVVSGDPFDVPPTSTLLLFLSGFEIEWPWLRFQCRFNLGKQITNGFVENKWDETLVTCPISPEVLLSNQMKFNVSIVSTQRQKHIISDVEIPLYVRRYHNISVYTMIRDKSRELTEWIEYHLLLGIEHFYLYDNFSNDEIGAVLKPYLEKNLVTIIRWPFKPNDGVYWNTIQRSSMNHALKNFGPFNRWMGYFDVDEYFQPNDMIANLITNSSTSLATLLDTAYPERDYPCGVQFEQWRISCFLSQTDLIQSRYSLTLEKCNVILDDRLRVPQKMFLRPKHIPILLNIHQLESGLEYKSNVSWREFGRFRHYHYGKVGDSEDLKKENARIDRTMDRYISILKQRIIKYQ